MTDAEHSGGSMRTVSGSTSEMVFEFTGTAATLIGPRGVAYGRAELFLDGKSLGLVRAYAPVELQRKVLWSTSGLSEGRHTLTVRVNGLKDEGSKGTAFAVDALTVSGTPAQSWVRAEDSDSRVTHVGGWAHHANAVASGGTYSSTTAPGGTFRARFTGSYVIVATKGDLRPRRGRRDGKSRAVDLYSSTTKRRQRSLRSAASMHPRHTTSRSGPSAYGRAGRGTA